MIKAVPTLNENRRIEALKMTKLLDTFPEELYDQFTQLASQICKTPIALLSLVDSDRQWFKSKIGVSDSQTARDISFCGHAIQNSEVFEVQDSKKDHRFHDNPLVTGDLGLRFYAGAPVVLGDGLAIGTLCVADKEPRALTDQQRNQLQNLSRILSSIIHFKSLGDQYELVLNTMHEAVIIHDSHGVVLDYNLRALEILGVNDDDLYLSKPGEDFWISRLFSRPAKTENPVLKAIQDRQVISNQVFEVKTADDNSRWILLNAVPDFDHTQKEIVQIIVTFTDITQLRQSEEKLAHSQRMIALGELAAGIAHEINNPLTVIQAKLRKIEKQFSNSAEEGHEVISDLKKTLLMTERIEKIVRSVKSMAYKSHSEDAIETFAIGQLIKETVEMIQGLSSNQQLQITFDGFENEYYVKGSSTEISQAINNLLTNATQAIRNLPERWIRIALERAHSDVIIRLTDSGTGIPPELRKRIMNPFFTTKQPGEGTGLGLSLAFQYISRSGGLLYLNEKSENTEFTIQLPIAQKVADKI